MRKHKTIITLQTKPLPLVIRIYGTPPVLIAVIQLSSVLLIKFPHQIRLESASKVAQ